MIGWRERRFQGQWSIGHSDYAGHVQMLLHRGTTTGCLTSRCTPYSFIATKLCRWIM